MSTEEKIHTTESTANPDYIVCAVTKDLMPFFKPFLPADQKTLSGGVRFYLGVFTPDKYPCAILAYDFLDGIYELHHLFVDPAHRRKGIGSLLMKKLFTSFYKTGMVFPFYLTYIDDKASSIGSFIRAQGNFVSDTSNEIYTLAPEHRKFISHYEKYMQMDTSAECFFDLDQTITAHFLRDQQKQGLPYLENLHNENAQYVKPLCLTICSDEKIQSAVFFKRSDSGNLVLSYLFSHKYSALHLRGLLAALIQKLEADYPQDTLEFQTVSPAAKRLFTGLFPADKCIQTEVCCAIWDYSV